MLEKILQIARAEIEKLNTDKTQTCWKYQLGDMTEFSDCFFFIHHIDFSNCPEEILLAGAPGFVINKESFEVKTVSHGGLCDLKSRDEEKEAIRQFLESINKDELQLTELKNKFSLDSSELLKLLKLIENNEITNEVLNELHPKWKVSTSN